VAFRHPGAHEERQTEHAHERQNPHAMDSASPPRLSSGRSLMKNVSIEIAKAYLCAAS